MARPKINTVEYFSHPVKNGTRMFIMEQSFGLRGYAAYYKLLELLGASEGHYLDFNEDKSRLFFQASIQADNELTNQIINKLVELGSIDKLLWVEKRIIWCDEFVSKLSDLYYKRGRIVEKPSFGPGNYTSPVVSEETNTQSIVKESKVKNSIVKESKDITDVILYLNEVVKSSFKPNSNNSIKFISARLNEKFTLDDFKSVIDFKFKEWATDEKMAQYLRPETLFGTKFEGYLQASKKIIINNGTGKTNSANNAKSSRDSLGDVARKILASDNIDNNQRGD